MILISGPQVMKAYLNQPEKTAQALLELEGKTWYVTGDKGHLDADGYLTIVDRYSRFAKIAGEMVSLGAVEHGIQTVLPEGAQCLAVNIPDEKKGEQIVLLITQVEVETAESLIKDSGLNPLMQPNKIIKVAELPKLGSGKPDYAQAKKLALE
jgi:acyl-[acyl-carrier-protein]-phospholipid O-acyltransferase/long-chain-fatty-acid--[acyl-carrier-protein] ligase